MRKTINISVSPELGFNKELLEESLRNDYHVKPVDDFKFIINRRSIDARRGKVKVNLDLTLFQNEAVVRDISFKKEYPDVRKRKAVIIVGAGPAGMFAALRLIELGLKPIILERGKDVRTRRRDIAAITKQHVVNEDSNYCFGEGGAGTYSDGKLYTRAKKRGNVRRILEILNAHGAREEILIDAHPHIGTNKLPQVVTELRNSILKAGGVIHFNARVNDLLIDRHEMKGVRASDGNEYFGEAVILATGHSARDIFKLLDRNKVRIEFKPFALGVRIEHQQSLIDSIQYHCENRGDYLPAASYSLVHQANYKGAQRGVFSFCMCPGGYIVPSATSPGELVVNGMSPSRRDSRFANSGIVVSVGDTDLTSYMDHGALRGMIFQEEVERKAFDHINKSQRAPAQRMLDFVKGSHSSGLNETSYQPGLESTDMYAVLPDFIAYSLKDAFKSFGKKMKGYLTNEAQLIGIESRTSSPVRIPRDKGSMEHIAIKRLFPCGEGAGYAGGIVSAAIDGERVAEQVVKIYA